MKKKEERNFVDKCCVEGVDFKEYIYSLWQYWERLLSLIVFVFVFYFIFLSNINLMHIHAIKLITTHYTEIGLISGFYNNNIDIIYEVV